MTALRPVALVCALLVPSTAISGDLIRFALSSRALACCAATKGACAQLTTPDTCCQTQEQAAGPGLAANGPDLQLSFPSFADQSTPIAFVIIDALELDRTTEAFKRPHDPPHLHLFPLLI